MRKLVAVILIMTLPIAGMAQVPNDGQRPEVVPGPSAEALLPPSNLRESSQGMSTDSTATQSDAFNICLRVTQRFEQQEQAKGSKKTAEAPLSASCKTELKPASYWQCMDKEAIEEVDFNTAHRRCAKQIK